jgi:ElaB/YqjD/DUF883 family membrane-anchored ribosome-binding protein
MNSNQIEEMKKAASESLAAARKEVGPRMTELRSQIKELQQAGSKTVGERPIIALGLAFLIGLSIGIALSKS